jgi:iron-sulfur cluster assembly 2
MFKILKNSLTQSSLNRQRIFNNNTIKVVKHLTTSTTTTTTTTSQEEEPIKIHDNCIKRLKELNDSNKYLRIIVDSGGCSGFEYKFSLDTKINKDDK